MSSTPSTPTQRTITGARRSTGLRLARPRSCSPRAWPVARRPGGRRRSQMRRLPVIALTVGLVALTLPTIAAAADACTYTFPPEGALYRRTVVAGDVLCGRKGHDTVIRMEGGTFRGEGGNDSVLKLHGGIFRGGLGRDLVDLIRGGTFQGGLRRDFVNEMDGGRFSGGDASDRIGLMTDGTFRGGAGSDSIGEMRDGRFAGGDDADGIGVLRGGTFSGRE